MKATVYYRAITRKVRSWSAFLSGLIGWLNAESSNEMKKSKLIVSSKVYFYARYKSLRNTVTGLLIKLFIQFLSWIFYLRYNDL